ncbi:Effector protein yopJ (Virulence factor yopJ) [Bartonella clarridgeiae 73]|uniref:Effector protein yopJ (Virulence factor yopJ) n=1 Tax=Bartonella clarridgeiae (strain CCUG 45776 / CIP 104772 / 73) TaxID=696125 RepID=E6YIF0_BARC7|nr:YopJ/AvrA family T3SS effector serine/threonine acetyltransferase [Bartonella clarridgeiae]WCR54795.1 MAG: Type III secretion injected virulence protein (YopP YopJ induces apoptosis prevents cytokine induction inhibits NFkb activation) [Bartonella clarridgeiae]CBI76638.1 Effector protein yopJ (Virulence factor yopJ) [Bartonella clarridgeiae 73]
MLKLRDLLNKIRCSKQNKNNVVSEQKEKAILRKKYNFIFWKDSSLKINIARLENDITHGSWFDMCYEELDLEMMPALIEKANKKYPLMNLKFSATPEDVPVLIQNTIDNEIQSSRLIVNVGNDRIHFSVIDHQTVNNKTSLILFEPVSFRHMKPAMLAIEVKIALERSQLPCHFSVVEMDIQRSSSECGIISLALAKKLYCESDKLERLHRDNINGVLYKSDTFFVSYDQLDKYLPVTFYKHTQSVNRLNEYIKSNPEAKHEIVNKKDEVIFERFDKNSVVIDDKKVSCSPHKKRIYEYKSLMR